MQRRPTLTTTSRQRDRTTLLPCAGVSAATVGDSADKLLVLQSVAPFNDRVASGHAKAATGVSRSYKVDDGGEPERRRRRCYDGAATREHGGLDHGGPRRPSFLLGRLSEDVTRTRDKSSVD